MTHTDKCQHMGHVVHSVCQVPGSSNNVNLQPPPTTPSSARHDPVHANRLNPFFNRSLACEFQRSLLPGQSSLGRSASPPTLHDVDEYRIPNGDEVVYQGERCVVTIFKSPVSNETSKRIRRKRNFASSGVPVQTYRGGGGAARGQVPGIEGVTDK